MAGNRDTSPQADVGKLTISLRAGEQATVETPEGEVVVTCVRGVKGGLSIQIAAPRNFNIKRAMSPELD